MPVTIKELAAQLGVSHSVVSSVLNNKPYCGVSEKRRREILDKAAELNCHPHPQARALKRGRTNLVGICMPASSQTSYSSLMLSQQKLLAEHGYLSLFSFWQVPQISPKIFRQELKNAFKAVFSNHAAGVIAWYYDDCLKREKIPAILFGCEHEGFDAVVPDFAGQAELTVDYLAELGHRRIAYLGFTGIQANQTRSSLAVRGLASGDDYFCIGHQINPLHFAGESLRRLLALPEPPSAVICHNMDFALGVYFAAGILGLRIPESLSLVSMGMSGRNSALSYRITSTGTNGAENIRLTVDRLMERMRAPALPAKTIPTRPELIDRGSCAGPPGNGR